MVRWVKIARLSAFFAPLSFLALTAAAAYNYPGYSMLANFLSGLGVGENSAVFFNAAAWVAGILCVVLAASLFKAFGVARNGSFFLALAGLSLISVGVFTENYGVLHTISTTAFFSAFYLALIAFGLGMRKMRLISHFSISVLFLVLVFVYYLGITPLVEHTAVASIIALSFAASILLKG